MSDRKIVERAVLECHEGGSNKDYDIWVEEKDGGYVVNAQWGPIGGWKQSGTKTPKPVSLEDAKKAMAKTVKEKLGKGYVIVGSGAGAAPAAPGSAPAKPAPAPYTQVEGKVDSGLRPMLLTEADEEEDLERYIADSGWAAQAKLNGMRLMVRVAGGKVIAANRKGLERPMPKPVEKALAALGDVVLDGELIGETFHSFDLLEEDGKDRRGARMHHRHDRLLAVLLKTSRESVRLVETAYGEDEKRKLAESQRAARKEGVVFKRVDSAYEPGREENLARAIAVKVKFLKDLSAVVKGWKQGKSSVELLVWDGDREVSIGFCTVPAKYVPQVRPGAVINVRYLYATDGDKLHQPRLAPTDDGVVVRDDLDPKDCKFSQLVYEGKEEEEEE